MKKDAAQNNDRIEVAETYLLRIFRRSSDLQESMVGTVEKIGGKQGEKLAFKTEKELLELIRKKGDLS